MQCSLAPKAVLKSSAAQTNVHTVIGGLVKMELMNPLHGVFHASEMTVLTSFQAMMTTDGPPTAL